MRLYKCLIFAVAIICGVLFAQQTALRKPAKYHMPAQYGDYSPVTDEERSEGDPWRVYCIYDKTQTYNEPELKSKFKNLKFMQPYYVYEEKNKMVRICKDEDIDGVLLNNPTDYGWVHKDKLLHSRRCVVTDPTSAINRKVMLINQKEHSEIIDFKSGPGNNYSATGKGSQMLSFFFAYEKTRVMDNATGKYTNWILLGNNERFSTWNYDDVIYGWVPDYRLIEWDQRVVLEPNWEEEAVRERKNGKRAIFFTEPEDLNKYVKTGEISPDFLWMETGIDTDKYERPNGEWKRFVLLPSDPRYPDYIKAIFVDSERGTAQIGYTLMNVSTQKHKIYKKLLFISTEEWTSLYGSIRKLLDTRSKEDLLKFMYEYAGTFYGEKSQSDYDAIRVEDLLKKIYGIASENSLLKDYKIEDIKSLTEGEFGEIMKGIELKNQQLQNIISDINYEYSFKTGGVTYFWLSEDYLP